MATAMESMGDMVTVMTNHLGKALLISSLSALVFLTGCKAGNTVSAEDASEVVLDDSGYKLNEVSDLRTQESKNGYIIEFTTPKGNFKYEVSKKGIIVGREIYKDVEPKSDISNQGKTDAKKELTEKPEPAKNDSSSNKEENVNHASEDKEQPAAETHQSSKDDQQAINLALANAGLTRNDVTDISVSQDGELTVVRFRFGDYINVCMVNLKEGRVVSTFFE